MEDESANEAPCCGLCDRCKLLCVRFCCCCCDGVITDSRGKYPHIHYGQLVPPQDTKQPLTEDDELPEESMIRRRYKYPQKYREYAIPPQLGGEGEKLLVCDQPRSKPHVSPDLSIACEEGEGEEEWEDEKEDRVDPSGFSSLDYGGNADVTFTRMKRPSLCYIERSPESTLKRGTHLTFPGQGKKMSISVLRPLDRSLLQKLEELKPESSPLLSGIHFSLYFDEQKSMLIVHVNRAVHLPTMRPVISSNPFIQVYLLPSKLEIQQSQSIDETHDPVFDRMFRFSHIPLEELRRQLLVMRLYINPNHFIGGVVYSLEEDELLGNKVVREIAEFDEEEGLRESCQGDILLGVCYHSRSNIVEVLVLEVSNLRKHDILRLPNPYVKINLLYRGQRMSKWKTVTKKSTTNPIFNEMCEVNISNLDIEEIQFDVVVMNYDRLGHNIEVGCVSFGDNVLHDSGQSHWKKIMIDTNAEICRWHPLLAPTSSIRSRSSSRNNSRSNSPAVRRSKSPMHVFRPNNT